MRLFNLDLHISVIADVKNIFQRIQPDIEITDWSISGHGWVFGQSKAPIEVVNAETWKSFDMDMVKKFQIRYESFLRQFDGFIVTFPPVFALLFEKYNKPIFMVNATRYEMPFCWQPNPSMQMEFEQRMLAMHQRGQLIAVSNNKADVDYLHAATGIQSEHIPSLCLYTNASYDPHHTSFPIFSKAKLASVENAFNVKDLGRYEWSELYRYKGIAHMPYEISTMSIFEHYSANMPLFLPSKNFLKRLLAKKRIPFNGPYTRKNYRAELSPMLGDGWEEFWVDRADYYDQENMPYITYYDSIYDLSDKLKCADTDLISQRMSHWNKQRQARVLAAWSKILKEHYHPHKQKTIAGSGQIKMRSEFGAQLYKLALDKRFNSYFEIGSWNGEGSTVCLMNGLMQRADDSRLYSLELYEEMFTKSQQFWSWLLQSAYAHQLVLLNGRITDNAMMPREDIENHPRFNSLVKAHYDKYYSSDVDNYNNAPNVYEKLPSVLDVIILDGGEFCTHAEYELLIAEKSPKVIVLDDTAVIKGFDARNELLADDDWVAIYDDQKGRNGAAIFIRRELH